MIKNLVIYAIPKEPEALKKVLKHLGDHSWSEEGIEAWVDNTKFRHVWYSDQYSCYMQGVCKVNSNFIYKKFSELSL